jgi:hypothetical protein
MSNGCDILSHGQNLKISEQLCIKIYLCETLKKRLPEIIKKLFLHSQIYFFNFFHEITDRYY